MPKPLCLLFSARQKKNKQHHAIGMIHYFTQRGVYISRRATERINKYEIIRFASLRVLGALGGAKAFYSPQSARKTPRNAKHIGNGPVQSP